MTKSFWNTLSQPIIGLAPMDGVTDAAFRYICDKYGHPSILITEFTSVEGIAHGVAKLLYSFIYHKTETPTIAQIFGSNPDAFYKTAIVLCEMGFDGIDINMGCPDKNVAKQGGGAALILKPDLAKEIIRKTKQGIADWSEGRTMKDAGLADSIIEFVQHFQKQWDIHPEKHILPVSVKTRIGYDAIVTESWIATLLEEQPANITVHGRTLKQLYSGTANWEELGKAAEIVRKTDTLILGNGDIKTIEDAKEKIKRYHTHGALIGRSTFGNPWVFINEQTSLAQKMTVALEQCQAFMKYTPELNFLMLRKHLAWYCKGYNDATGMRAKLMSTTNIQEAEEAIREIIQAVSD